MDIVNMGMKYLGPVVANKVASMLGINNTVVTKLIAAALPTVLATFVGKSSSASGASSLLGLVQDQPIGSPDDLLAALDGPQAGNVAEAGTGLLGDLLGGDAMSAITGALSRHGGVDTNNAGSLLGMIAPAALGALKGQVSEQNLDAGGLAALLAGQKDNIAQAMPAGFANQLQGTGLLDGVIPPETTPTPAPAAAPAPQAASSGGGGGLLKIALPVVAIAAAAWYFLSGNDAPEMPEMPDVASLTEGMDLTVGDVDLGEQFGGVMGGLTDTFTGITDTASAEAAVPALEEASAQLDGLTDLAGQLPEEAQGAFGGVVSTALASLRPMIQSAIDASGAGSILQPIADGILAKLEGIAG